MSSYVEDALEDAISKNEKSESTKKILDSGSRRQFESGAVRDIQEGKGRCDLLPFGVISDWFMYLKDGSSETVDSCNWANYAAITFYLYHFMLTGNKQSVYKAIKQFSQDKYDDPYTAILELAKHYEEGAKKYSERNWEKGMPTHCYIDSAVRHLTKFYRGDQDEPHDRAFLWNMFGLLWTMVNHPECNDLPYVISIDKEPEEFINDDGSITKKCQRCGRYFETMHKSNRICSTCKDIVNGGPD